MKKANIGLALLLALVTLAGCDQQGVTSAGSSSESSTGTSAGGSSSQGGATDSGSSSTPVVETHSILIGETGGATVTPSKETASSGERITLTIDCPEGKEVDTISLSVAEVEVTENPDGTYSFLMPAGDVTVTVTLKDEVLSSYVLTIDNKAGVEIVDLMDSRWNSIAANGDGTYDLKPNETYTILIVRGSGTGAYRVRLGETIINANEGSYSFTMPAANATLTIESVPSYKVTFDYDADAISEVYLMDSDAMTELNAGSIVEGTNVYVSPTTNPGYAVTAILLDGESLELEGTSAFFEMPARDVTLTIETEGEAPAGHAIDIQEPDGISISIGSEIVENETYFGTRRELVPYPFDQTTWEAGETIYVQAEVMGPYAKILTLEKVTWNGNEITLDEDGFGSFVMPEEGVVLTAETEWIYYDLSFDGGDTGITATFANEEGTTAVAHQGETITVTLDVPEGVTVDQVLVNGTPAEDKYIEWTESEEEPYVYTFTMPYEDVVIEVQRTTEEEKHAITWAEIPGDIKSDLSNEVIMVGDLIVNSAAAGDEVTVYLQWWERHDVVLSMNGTPLPIDHTAGYIDYYVFEMPDEDVVLTVAPAETYGLFYNTSIAELNDTISVDFYTDPNSSEPVTEAESGKKIYVWIRNFDGYEIESVTLNGVALETETVGYLQNTYYVFNMPEADAQIEINLKALESAGHAITYECVNGDGREYVAFYFDDGSGNNLGSQIPLNQLSNIEAGERIYIDVTNGSWTVPSKVTLNGEEITETDSTGFYFAFTMPEEDAHLVFTWEGGEEEPPVTGDSYRVTYQTSGNEPADFEITMMDEMSNTISTAKPGDTVYVSPWPNEGISAVYVNGDPCLYMGYGIWYFTMPNEEAVVTIEWGASASFSLNYAAGVDDPYTAEVMFFDEAMTGQITEADEGDIVLVNVFSEEGQGQIESVLVNGVAATPYEDYEGTYYFEMPAEGAATVTINWFIY